MLHAEITQLGDSEAEHHTQALTEPALLTIAAHGFYHFFFKTLSSGQTESLQFLK